MQLFKLSKVNISDLISMILEKVEIGEKIYIESLEFTFMKDREEAAIQIPSHGVTI